MALAKSAKSEYGTVDIKAHGIPALVEYSYTLLDESVRDTFVAYQKQSVKLKIDTAKKISIGYAGAVAAAAFQPFPIADAPIMVAIQVVMMAHITACFGFDPSLLKFKSILTGLGGPFAAALVGRTLVSLLKFIPGLGTAAGGAINAAVGGGITIALANVYIAVLSSITERNGEFDEQTIIDELNKAMNNVDMDAAKKEWEESKGKYSEAEADDILKKAKDSLG
ncbi:MAG: hypothetical protein FWB99_08250 [Treponema sp.]|nr:hypothetical protein [Treponema sp.]